MDNNDAIGRLDRALGPAACALALALAGGASPALADGASGGSGSIMGTEINANTVPLLGSASAAVQSGLQFLGGIVALFGLVSFGFQLATKREMQLNDGQMMGALAALVGGAVVWIAATAFGAFANDPSSFMAASGN